jgi:hypothetical protein
MMMWPIPTSNTYLDLLQRKQRTAIMTRSWKQEKELEAFTIPSICTNIPCKFILLICTGYHAIKHMEKNKTKFSYIYSFYPGYLEAIANNLSHLSSVSSVVPQLLPICPDQEHKWPKHPIP